MKGRDLAPGVVRLPVQHHYLPHCTHCGADLPNFDGAAITLGFGGLGTATLEAMTFHVICLCGKPWDLRKVMK